MSGLLIGTTFNDGGTYTAADVNNAVNLATPQPSFITQWTTVSPAATDTLLLSDASDSGNLKQATISSIAQYTTLNSNVYAIDTGSANAYEVTLSPVPVAYTTGMSLDVKWANANTGASTINVNSLGTKNIFYKGVALTQGAITANLVSRLSYDGTQFNLEDAGIPDGSITSTQILNGTILGTDIASDTVSLSNLTTDVQGALVGFKNRLINPFLFNQRGASSVTDDSYSFDRWYGLSQTAAQTVSQLSNVENGLPTMLRMTQPQASAQRIGHAQIIESNNCVDLRGSTVTLSARVRMSASTNIRYAILEHTGTADSVTSDVVNDWTSATYTASNFFISINVLAVGSTALTANTPASISLNATVGSSANNLIVFFWSESTMAQNATMDIGKVQFEKGSTVTAFDLRSIGTEISLCNRHLNKSYSQGVAPATSTLTGIVVLTTGTSNTAAMATDVRFKQTMFSAPSVTVYDGVGNAGRCTRAGDNRLASANNISNDGFTFQTDDTTASAFFYGHYLAISEL